VPLKPALLLGSRLQCLASVIKQIEACVSTEQAPHGVTGAYADTRARSRCRVERFLGDLHRAQKSEPAKGQSPTPCRHAINRTNHQAASGL